jgi:hypothetical protein
MSLYFNYINLGDNWLTRVNKENHKRYCRKYNELDIFAVEEYENYLYVTITLSNKTIYTTKITKQVNNHYDVINYIKFHLSNYESSL